MGWCTGVAWTMGRFVGFIPLAGSQLHCPRWPRFVQAYFSVQAHILYHWDNDRTGLRHSLTLDRVARVMERRNCFRDFSTSHLGSGGRAIYVGQDPLGFYSGKRRGEITSHLLNFTVRALPVSGHSTQRERWSGCWMLLATSCKFARHLLYSMRYNEMRALPSSIN